MAEVAVVIPVFNAAAFVLDAVASAREQEPPPHEVVAVDNGSTDASVAMLKAAGVRVVAEPVRGAGAARRRGLIETTAPYLLFLDHDDLLLPGALSALSDALTSGGFDLVCGTAANELMGEEADLGMILHMGTAHAAPLASATLVRRTAFERLGPFPDDNLSFPRWLLSARRARAAIGQIDHQVAIRRIHADNMSHSAETRASMFGVIREHRRLMDAIDRDQGAAGPDRQPGAD